jgi:hypothetical protein
MEIEVDRQKFCLETMTASCGLNDNVSAIGRRRHCDGDDDGDVHRPNKRQGNRFTMTRIAAYPRIKVTPPLHLSSLHSV